MQSYSFKDLAAVLNHPLAGPFVIQGQLGLGHVTVDPSSEHTTHDVSADGNVLISITPGDNAVVTFEMQQNSSLHRYFLNWWNAVNAAMQNGDMDNAANLTVTLRNTVTGTSHRALGGSPPKVPGTPYGPQAARISWPIPFGDVQNLTA